MPSPFPGMNPYLEHPDAWHDFHQSFLVRMRDAINAQVGQEYLVKVEEHIYVQELGSEHTRQFVGRADIGVTERYPVTTSGDTAVLDAPVHAMLLPVDKYREAYLEILNRRDLSLVTVVEMLSPSNKSGRDRQQYLAKRDQLLASPAHLVEIDFLRGGQRMPFQGLPPCDYYVMVSRAEQRPTTGIWPIGLRERLPIIPIPLKAGDADVSVNLQAVFNEIFDTAGYAKYIYENEPSPPLMPDIAAWAAALLND